MWLRLKHTSFIHFPWMSSLDLKVPRIIWGSAAGLLSELFPVWDLCVCKTPATMESGQKRCVGRCWDFIFFALGAGSGLLASSMGWRIRLRALMNLRTYGSNKAHQNLVKYIIFTPNWDRNVQRINTVNTHGSLRTTEGQNMMRTQTWSQWSC